VFYKLIDDLNKDKSKIKFTKDVFINKFFNINDEDEKINA